MRVSVCACAYIYIFTYLTMIVFFVQIEDERACERLAPCCMRFHSDRFALLRARGINFVSYT